MEKYVKKMTNMEIPKYNLSHLDCEVTAIYERRNLLTGRLDAHHNNPVEIVFSFPVSMGERGFMDTVYYDELPNQEQVEMGAKIIMRDFEKNAGNGFYEEQAAKIIRKVLRKK